MYVNLLLHYIYLYFFLLIIIKVTVSTAAKASAVKTEIHTPSMPSNSGRIRTEATWNISVRINEMTADIRPLLRAVKKDEPKMLKPHIRNESEYIRKPRVVSASRTAS